MTGSRRLRFGGGHVDFGAQGAGGVGEFAGFHAGEQVQIFFDGAVAIGALLTGFGKRAALFADFVGREIADVGFAGLDQLDGPIVELIEIIGGVVDGGPFATEPADVLHDGIDVFGFFLGGIGVVEAQIAFAAEFLRESEIDGDGFGVADVQIAVRLRREARVHAAPVFIGLQILEMMSRMKFEGAAGVLIMFVYPKQAAASAPPCRAANLAAAAFQAALVDWRKSLPAGRLQPKLAALQDAVFGCDRPLREPPEGFFDSFQGRFAAQHDQVSNRGGAFLRPHTATRMGWNIWPGLDLQFERGGAEGGV